MRHFLRVLLSAMVALAFCLLPGAGGSQAAGSAYIDQIAAAFRANHVFVDPDATAMLSTQQKILLEQNIAETGRPIYVVVTTSEKAGKAASNPDFFLSGLNAAMGSKAEHVIGVATTKGFYANGFNATDQVNKAAGPTAKQIAGASRNVSDALAAWVTAMDEVYGPVQDAPGVPQTPRSPQPVSAQADDGMTWAWVVLGLILAAIFAIAGYMIWVNRSRRNDDHVPSYAARRESTRSRKPRDIGIDRTGAASDEGTDQFGLPHADPPAPTYMPSAPKRPVHSTSHTPHKKSQRKSSKPATVRQKVLVDGRYYDYRHTSSGSHDRYFAGGHYNGVSIPPGYYDRDFVQNAILWGLMTSHHHESHTTTPQPANEAPVSMGTTGGGSWGSNSDDEPTSGKTDGGSWGFKSDDEDSKSGYTAPAYDPSPAWSSSDTTSGSTDGGSWGTDSSSSTSTDTGSW